MGYDYYKGECAKCGSKILVEFVLSGLSHHQLIAVTSTQCLGLIAERFKTEKPEAARDIEEWMKIR